MAEEISVAQKIRNEYKENLKNIEKDLNEIEIQTREVKINLKNTALLLEEIDSMLEELYKMSEKDFKKINILFNKKSLFTDQLIKFQDNLKNVMMLKYKYRTEHDKIIAIIQRQTLDYEKESNTAINNMDLMNALKQIGTEFLKLKSAPALPESEEIKQYKNILLEVNEKLETNPDYSMD